MKKMFALISITVAAMAAAPARADDSGFTLALRAGYGIPMGDILVDQGVAESLSDNISGKIPLWIDVGYRINKAVFVGAYFQYGIGFVNESTAFGGACQLGASCSAYNMRFGIEGIYNFSPDASFAPWAGLGVGYEIANLSAEFAGQKASGTVRGFEYVNLQVGGDYKVSPTFSVGPYVAFSLAQFSEQDVEIPGQPTLSGSIPETAMHEWLQLGVKGTFNF